MISGQWIANSSSFFVALKRKFIGDYLYGQLCDTKADNREHGLVSTGNGNADLTVSQMRQFCVSVNQQGDNLEK
jgi:hypothetical protein